ncbi:hypothetical protein PTSG_10969 [Salpingoeca rosetta]|uniref:Dynein assembly factor 3, axonemal n=1 Tax=Salpingoeca rosetta (strain ATCC 50818 / BSB-021) TaxID=946362 RepID=F2USB7_SALR5|nr:uncharacterized protein PTSG_10969 [Salpingoeca rosetta]EGD81026.1 hypothetical protein PTSG_10969 [Salpingoeca rosetta]|eukprot:XP_004987896.1 hypothetical protein PTSG_10969 [Salpingoeca rosetta]
MSEGVGRVAWWGLSPAMDPVTTLLDAEVVQADGDEPINVLLVGASDCRHMLKMLAAAKRGDPPYNKGRQVNVYVVESRMEVVARHLLLLSIAMKPTEELGLQERTHLFLELFGNSHVRPVTNEFLCQEATRLIRLVTDPDEMQQQMPWFRINHLKFRECDDLEAILKFWRTDDTEVFPIAAHWDERLRSFYKQRYDVRTNLYDWDYSMNISEKAPIINARQFARWRETGLAFELHDTTYEIPNRTLASGELLKSREGTVARRGYWGDILTGPYVSFGIEPTNEKMLEKRNDQYVKSAVDVSEDEVSQLMAELLPAAEAADDTGARVTIHVLSPNSLETLTRKRKFQHMFHAMFFSSSMAHLLSPDVQLAAKPNARLLMETGKFVLALNKEQTQQYLDKTIELAQAAGFSPVKPPTVNDAVYVCKRNEDASQ